MRIEEIDKNFLVDSNLERDGLTFFDTKKEPFEIYGAFKPFERLPQNVAEGTNKGVAVLYKNTSGIRVRFRTDSPYVAIYAKLSGVGKFSHFALTGVAGFDMYEYTGSKYTYLKTFIPCADNYETLKGVYDFPVQGTHSLVINFPLYSGVDELYIGIKEGSEILCGDKYINEKPIVFYGSSITQGGCASRPGTCYQSILSRRFNVDFINLGFSGSALGEDIITEYMSTLDMSMFVLDYDHNAPDATHLKNTHEKIFKAIRSNNPDIPVIMLSMPFDKCVKDPEERREVIKQTYNKAVNSGDENVYFIDGSKMPAKFGEDNGSVDGCHPNDLGFMCMAEKISEVFQIIAEKGQL